MEQLSELATGYELDMHARDLSVHTRRNRITSIRMYGDWLAEQGQPTDTSALNKGAIQAWQLALVESGLQNSTIVVRLKSLRAFCAYLVDEGDLAAVPVIKLPAVRIKPVPILSDDEIRALLGVCGARSTFDGARNEALIRVLTETGIRRAELAGMVVDDVDMDRRVLYIMGKGQRAREVPFGKRTASALHRYLRLRPKHRHAEAEGLWLGTQGAFSADGVYFLLLRLGKRAGVKVHPHMFRHTLAHNWLAAEGQEGDLRRIAGWSANSNVIRRYGASLADERAHAAARRLGLGDRF